MIKMCPATKHKCVIDEHIWIGRGMWTYESTRNQRGSLGCDRQRSRRFCEWKKSMKIPWGTKTNGRFPRNVFGPKLMRKAQLNQADGMNSSGEKMIELGMFFSWRMFSNSVNTFLQKNLPLRRVSGHLKFCVSSERNILHQMSTFIWFCEFVWNLLTLLRHL